MLNFYFNKEAFTALAKEMRRASWGVVAFAGGIGYQANSGVVILLGGGGWLLLQMFAFVLESLKNEKGASK